METYGDASRSQNQSQRKSNQNIQVYVRLRPLNARERIMRSSEVVEVVHPREIITRHSADSKLKKKFTFDRTFGPDSRHCDVYSTVVAPLIEEVLAGYNCTVFAYGQTGTGKTHTMVGNECAELTSSWEDDSEIGIIPRALCHLFDELRMMEVEHTMRISYLELYNEELCDLLSTDDTTKIRIFDDTTKKGSVIIQGLEEIPVHSKDDVYKLLQKGKERRKTATTLMNAQSSRSHTVFSILVHIRENGIDGEDMLKIGKLNLVDLAGSENVTKAGNEKGIRVRETVNINQSLLTLGRVITALVERTPHIPYRESKLTRLLQESLGGRTKTSIIATISPGHKDIDETLSTLEYAARAKNIQNKPEINQKLTKKTVLKEYTEEIDKLKRDLMAARDKNGIYLAEETYSEMMLKMDSQNRELNEKMLLLKALKDELMNKEKIFNEVSMSLVQRTQELKRTEQNLTDTKGSLLLTKKVLTKTKRRYKEKKTLVASHVKTETELTTQANQILDAADLASSDTQQLLNTIDRRRHVDDVIRTACEQFATHMEENINDIDENLTQYHDQQKATAQLLTEELANCTKVHQRMIENTKKNIEGIRSSFNGGLEAYDDLHAKFGKSVSTLSDEQCQSLVNQIMEYVQSREIEIKKNIMANLNELESNNEKEISSLDGMRECFTNFTKANVAAVEKHVVQVQSQLNEMKQLSCQDAQELQQLKIELANEQALAQQEQTLLDDFVRQMEQIKQLREKTTNGMEMHLKQLESRNHTVTNQTEKCLLSIKEFGQQQAKETQQAEQKTAAQLDATVLLVDQSVAHCSKLQMQLENVCKESSRQAEESVLALRGHSEQVRKICESSGEQAKLIRTEQQQKMQLAGNQMESDTIEEIELGRGHIAVTGELVEAATNQTQCLAVEAQKQLQTCLDNLQKFTQSELKIYSPTGLTPSKRDYIYPRTLASTSPHQIIVKRYRQEQDWSDLDTTATIDEGSENEEVEEEGLHSVQELSESETIMNSTPIEGNDGVNMGNRAKRSSATLRSSNNNLKPLPNNRSSSLSRSLTPSKQRSPKQSPVPMYKRENKENVA